MRNLFRKVSLTGTREVTGFQSTILHCFRVCPVKSWKISQKLRTYYKNCQQATTSTTADTKVLKHEGTMPQSEYIQEVINDIEKSASDQREYRGLILKNKLKVLLISDKKTFKSAVSLSVGVGSLSDPAELPGLAHFVEHMLFMGSKKYPIENEYDKFITDHGGSTNAYTFEDYTNYHYDIAPESLKESLDMFAQFFISPLFNEDSAEREVQAVDSEHEANIPDDDWRTTEVIKVTSDPSHPYSKFSTGNLTTLWTRPLEKNIDVRSALLKFHDDYYSSNIMTLAVLGSEPLDELCELVTELFHPILNKNVVLPTWSQPFSEKQQQTCVYDVPIKDLRKLTLVFPIPDDRSEFYQTGSAGYLSHLVGHEGKGSLLSLLKSKNWVNELVADSEETARGFNLFFIYLELTVSGLKHKEDVILHVFQYFQLIKDFGPLEWIWEELKNVDAMLFRFRDKEDPINYVSDLTSRMIVYPLEHAISAGHVLTRFDPDRIRELLKYFTPSNFRCLVTTKENTSKENLTEEYYGIQYSVSQIDEKLIKKWTDCGTDESLKLPAANDFIPTNFDLKPRDNSGIIPKVIAKTPFSRVWFLQDNEFLLPKAFVYVEFHSALPLKSPLNAALNYMLKVTLEDSLNEFAYAATIAGLEFSLTETVYGLQVWCGGYDHKLHNLLECVLNKMVNYSLDEKRFVVLKEAFQRKLQNWKKSQPRSHAEWYLTYLLRRERWTHDQLIESLPDVTPEKVQEYSKRFISRLSLEWLVYGNVEKEEAKQVVLNCENLLRNFESVPLPESECVLLQELKLEEGADYVYRKPHNFHADSCKIVLYQCGLFSTRKIVLMELLNQIIREPCFDELRTKEQLGYNVWSEIRKSNGTQGLQIVVQSKFHPEFLECRIDNFLESFYNDTLLNMSEEDFLKHRDSLKTHKSEKPKKLWERAALVWDEIVFRQFNFDRQKIELEELETITKKDILTYFSELIGTGQHSNSRKRLAIQVISMTNKGAGKKQHVIKPESKNKYKREGVHIENVAEWKNRHSFYEIPIDQQIQADLIIA